MVSLDRRVHQQELRLEVFARLDILRSRLENQIDSGLRVARSMAVLLADEGEVSQERYSKFASEISADLTGIINIA
jgi:sensor domain CHASE-containing protein